VVRRALVFYGEFEEKGSNVQDSDRQSPQTTKDAILKGIQEIIQEVTDVPSEKVQYGMRFVCDLGIDSLSMIEVAVQAEDKYGIIIPDEDLAGLDLVDDAVNYICEGLERTGELQNALARMQS